MPPVRRRSAGPPVIYELCDHGRVALITLNRPGSLNAYDVTMRDGLFAALDAVADDPGVAAVVLRGNGRAFCAGGDLREFGSAPSPTRAREVRWLRDVWGTLQRLPAITIAAVHGYAVGSGFEMVVLCDLCIATPRARFALPETGIGMIPGVGGTQTVPRLAGLGRGLDLVLTGRVLDAATAHAFGLVARVVATRRLRAVTLATARRIARMPRAATQALKRAIGDGLDGTLANGLALERRLADALRPGT
jgi:enoyl-CoA hydratase/carnithine racemase